MVSVCFGCTRRHVGCHSTCGVYIEESKENERIRENKAKDRNDYTSKGAMKAKRRQMYQHK